MRSGGRSDLGEGKCAPPLFLPGLGHFPHTL